MAFRTGRINFKTQGGKYSLGRPAYLLFLKARPDGRYEAVSGQVDPKLSVRETHSPLPAGLGEGESEDD